PTSVLTVPRESMSIKFPKTRKDSRKQTGRPKLGRPVVLATEPRASQRCPDRNLDNPLLPRAEQTLPEQRAHAHQCGSEERQGTRFGDGGAIRHEPRVAGLGTTACAGDEDLSRCRRPAIVRSENVEHVRPRTTSQRQCEH